MFSSQFEIQDFFMQGYNNVMGAVSIRDKLIGRFHIFRNETLQGTFVSGTFLLDRHVHLSWKCMFRFVTFREIDYLYHLYVCSCFLECSISSA
jgi:hypothetical protein